MQRSHCRRCSAGAPRQLFALADAVVLLSERGAAAEGRLRRGSAAPCSMQVLHARCMQYAMHAWRATVDERNEGRMHAAYGRWHVERLAEYLYDE